MHALALCVGKDDVALHRPFLDRPGRGDRDGLTARRSAVPVLAAVLLLLAACGPQPQVGQGVPLQPGWTELPPAPYSSELRDPIVLWADGELIVAGGHEFPEP